MRLHSGHLLAALISVGLWGQGTARAQGAPSAKEQAESLNTEGKKLIKQLDLAGAAQRFRAALALSEDPRFAFNLCYTLEKSGKLVEAKEACERVMADGNSRLVEKANRLLAVIEESLAGGAPKPPPAPPGPGGSLRRPPPVQPAKPVASVPSTPPPKKAKTSYGVIAGLSRANVQATFGDPEPKVGLALGGGMRVRLRPNFDSVIDAQFVQRGFQTSSVGIDGVDGDLTANYLDLGFASRWYLSEGAFRPYAEVGMALSVLLFDSATIAGQEVDPEIQPLDISYSLGVGSRIPLGAVSLDIRARYMYGLLNTAKSDVGIGATDTSGFNRALLIQTGLWF